MTTNATIWNEYVLYLIRKTCAKISLVSRTHARISHLCMGVIFIINILVIITIIIIIVIATVIRMTTCLVQLPDNWVGAVVEQRGRQTQVGANLFTEYHQFIIIIIINIILVFLNIIIIISYHLCWWLALVQHGTGKPRGWERLDRGLSPDHHCDHEADHNVYDHDDYDHGHDDYDHDHDHDEGDHEHGHDNGQNL